MRLQQVFETSINGTKYRVLLSDAALIVEQFTTANETFSFWRSIQPGWEWGHVLHRALLAAQQEMK